MSFSPGKNLKDAVQAVLGRFGYQFRKLPHRLRSTNRTVGDMPCFLQDLADRGFRPRNILDVGANEGLWTRRAAAVFSGASFVMIEPQQEMRPHLEAVCREIPTARTIQAGAGAAAGELVLTIWEDLQGSSLLPREDTPQMGDKEKRVVPIITIDSLYPEAGSLPDLVKLDIQGFELEALKGAQTLFGRTEMFILEVSLYEFLPNCPLISEVISFMSQRGYQIYDFPGFSRRPLDGALGQADIAFAREKGFLRASCEW